MQLAEGIDITAHRRSASAMVYVGKVPFECRNPIGGRIEFFGKLVDEVRKPPEYVARRRPKKDYCAP